MDNGTNVLTKAELHSATREMNAVGQRPEIDPALLMFFDQDLVFRDGIAYAKAQVADRDGATPDQDPASSWLNSPIGDPPVDTKHLHYLCMLETARQLFGPLPKTVKTAKDFDAYINAKPESEKKGFAKAVAMNQKDKKFMANIHAKAHKAPRITYGRKSYNDLRVGAALQPGADPSIFWVAINPKKDKKSAKYIENKLDPNKDDNVEHGNRVQFDDLQLREELKDTEEATAAAALTPHAVPKNQHAKYLRPKLTVELVPKEM